MIEQMNKTVKEYYEKSRPAYCAKMGLVDEVAKMTDLESISSLSPIAAIRTRRRSARSTR